MGQNNLHPFTEKLNADLAKALQEFGTYSFDDKGPEEVMQLNNLINEYAAVAQIEKEQIAQEISQQDPRVQTVFISIIGPLQNTLDRKEFLNIIKLAGPDVEDFYAPTDPDTIVFQGPIESAADVLKKLFKP